MHPIYEFLLYFCANGHCYDCCFPSFLFPQLYAKIQPDISNSCEQFYVQRKILKLGCSNPKVVTVLFSFVLTFFWPRYCLLEIFSIETYSGRGSTRNQFFLLPHFLQQKSHFFRKAAIYGLFNC